MKTKAFCILWTATDLDDQHLGRTSYSKDLQEQADPHVQAALGGQSALSSNMIERNCRQSGLLLGGGTSLHTGNEVIK